MNGSRCHAVFPTDATARGETEPQASLREEPLEDGTRDLHEVSSARGNSQMSSGNSPETSQEFRSPQQYHNGSVDRNSSGGSSGKKSRSRGKQNRRSPRNREYNQLLQMAHERAVSQQAEPRPPFVSTGRRQSLFSNMKGNGRVQNSRAVVEQAAREYSEVAGGDEFYY